MMFEDNAAPSSCTSAPSVRRRGDAVLDTGAIGLVGDTDHTLAQGIAGQPPRSADLLRLPMGDRVLKDITGYLVQRCCAHNVLLLWSSNSSEANMEILYSQGPDATQPPLLTAARKILRAYSDGDSRSELEGSLLTAAIELDGGAMVIACDLQLSNGCDSYNCLMKLRDMLPLMRPLFQIWISSQRALARIESLHLVIEESDVALILLGSGAEIIYVNRAAERMLATMNGLCRRGQRLVCCSLSDTLRLQAAIDLLNEPSQGEKGLSPVLALGRPDRRPLTIALTAVPQRQRPFSDKVTTVAYILDPEKDLTEVLLPACQLYRLSHRETKLTCALVDGLSLCEAARRLGVRDQTARSYLKHVFIKTETNRQAELVQLMLKSAVRVSCQGRTQAFV